MKNKLTLAAALALASSAAFAQSGEKDGWYAGLDLGYTRLGISGGDIDGALANQGIASSTSIDQSDKSIGISGGYRFNRNFAAEAAWESLGRYAYSSTTAADTINGKLKPSALSLSALGIYPFTRNWSAYGKLGVTRTEMDLTASSTTGATAVSNQSSSSTGWLVGGGLTYDFDGGYYTKLGWDRYEHVGDSASTGKGSIDLYQIGVGMRF
ncbi:MAG: outer membrane beta-barrel protein [Betaproteobacteria bacterium]|nr:outer membrane beta-barrel protein [Betaproteobacteria bacterium]MBV9361638.1 outer membrane beta-barrel protein [Betaproteobacteria bacterium]